VNKRQAARNGRAAAGTHQGDGRTCCPPVCFNPGAAVGVEVCLGSAASTIRYGRQLVTLQEAGTYITKLPKADEAPEWQAAMEALILVVTLGGPTMFARIGMMRALNRHVERVFDPSRKDTHWGKRKLKRDE
jgi:hypothetical protein